MTMSFTVRARRAARAVWKAAFVSGTISVLGAAIIAIVTVLFGIASGDDPWSILSFFLFWLPFLLIFSFSLVLMALLFIGIPTMTLLRRFGAETAFSYRVTGTAAGAALALVLGWGDPFFPGLIMLVGSGYGAMTGELFFRVFRADRAAANAE